MAKTHYQQLAQQLSECSDYQILSRLQPKTTFNSNPSRPLHKMCIIDTETTGLNTQECELIELGYQIVEFDALGNLFQVLASENFLNEPKGIISAEVTQVTGLTLEDVKGHTIPWQQVASQLEDVSLIVAHNAGFDRPILERYHPIFATKVWGCSVKQIDWFNLAKVGSKSQEFLAWKVGHFFYDAHRALDDVQALTELLSRPIGEPAQPALFHLLNAAKQQTVLIKATGAPFAVKDALKQQGYHWNNAERVWQKTLPAEAQAAEQAWLAANSTPKPTIIALKATDSFSVRAQ